MQLSQTYHSVTILCSFFIISQMTGTARADANLNCNAYAQSAVNQQAMNLKLNCGFKGNAWSSNYAGHAAWCKQAHVKMADLTNEQKLRQAALSSCSQKKGPGVGLKKARDKSAKRAKYCKKYATNAQKMRKLVVKHCGGLNEWPGGWKEDYADCFKIGGASADRKNKQREQRAKNCRSANNTKVLKGPDISYNHKRYGRLYFDVCNRKGELFQKTCGQAWATKLCGKHGFKKAQKYTSKTNDQRASALGVKADRPSTWWAGARKICHGKCSHFTSITCVGAK